MFKLSLYFCSVYPTWWWWWMSPCPQPSCALPLWSAGPSMDAAMPHLTHGQRTPWALSSSLYSTHWKERNISPGSNYWGPTQCDPLTFRILFHPLTQRLQTFILCSKYYLSTYCVRSGQQSTFVIQWSYYCLTTIGSVLHCSGFICSAFDISLSEVPASN